MSAASCHGIHAAVVDAGVATVAAADGPVVAAVAAVLPRPDHQPRQHGEEHEEQQKGDQSTQYGE